MDTIANIIKNQQLFFKSQQTKDVSQRIKLLKALKLEIESNEQAILNALNKDFKKSEFEAYLSEFGIVISALLALFIFEIIYSL